MFVRYVLENSFGGYVVDLTSGLDIISGWNGMDPWMDPCPLSLLSQNPPPKKKQKPETDIAPGGSSHLLSG